MPARDEKETQADMKSIEQCVQDEALVLLAQTHGIDEVFIRRCETGHFDLSVKLKGKRDRFYLATRRSPDEPRSFKRPEVAMGIAHKLLKIERFTVLWK